MVEQDAERRQIDASTVVGQARGQLLLAGRRGMTGTFEVSDLKGGEGFAKRTHGILSISPGAVSCNRDDLEETQPTHVPWIRIVARVTGDTHGI